MGGVHVQMRGGPSHVGGQCSMSTFEIVRAPWKAGRGHLEGDNERLLACTDRMGARRAVVARSLNALRAVGLVR